MIKSKFAKFNLLENPDSSTYICIVAIARIDVADDGSHSMIFLLAGGSVQVIGDAAEKLGIKG